MIVAKVVVPNMRGMEESTVLLCKAKNFMLHKRLLKFYCMNLNGL